VRAWIAAAIAFVLFVFFAPLKSRDGRSFQIDEVAKISETHFLRLYATGDFDSPEWWGNIIDRTNMPMGKYLFGASIVLHGLPLPPAPSLGVYAPKGDIPAVFPREVNERYKQYLVPARRASIVFAGLAAASIVFLAMRIHGVVAAIAAFLFFTFHELTLAFGGLVARDTLMAGAFALAALAVFYKKPVLAGLACGMAIGIRLNGGVALVFAVIAMRSWRSAIITVLVAAAFVFAIHPYYWGDGRPFYRVEQQLRDLQTMVSLLPPGIEMRSPLRRIAFFGTAIVDGVVGIALWIAVMLGILLPMRKPTEGVKFAWLWAGIVVGLTVLLQPVAWQRYMIAVLPPLALLGGIGVGHLISPPQRHREH
jgi:hypothetical protein